jgi:hypothetical protein
MSADMQSSTTPTGKRLICQILWRRGVDYANKQTTGDNNNSETRHNTRDKPEMVLCISS